MKVKAWTNIVHNTKIEKLNKRKTNVNEIRSIRYITIFFLFKDLIPYLYKVLPACIPAGQKRAPDPNAYGYEPP